MPPWLPSELALSRTPPSDALDGSRSTSLLPCDVLRLRSNWGFRGGMEDGGFEGLGAWKIGRRVLTGGRRCPIGGLGCGGVPTLVAVSPIASPRHEGKTGHANE